MQVQSYVNEGKEFMSILVKWASTVARRTDVNVPNHETYLGVEVVWFKRYARALEA